MILYVNGDSHSAGAEAINTFCFAEDDPKYPHLYRRPHPDNLEVSYGKKLALALNMGFATDAESAASNDRILRTSREFLSKNGSKSFAVIGWTTPEREEWLHDGIYYQVNASGHDMVPVELEEKYKKYVANCTNEHYNQKLEEWDEKIYDFHIELKDHNIPHLFFNTFNRYPNKYDWNDYFVKDVYFNWLKDNGYKTKHVNSWHFGADGHTAWAKHLISYLQKQL